MREPLIWGFYSEWLGAGRFPPCQFIQLEFIFALRVAAWIVATLDDTVCLATAEQCDCRAACAIFRMYDEW